MESPMLVSRRCARSTNDERPHRQLFLSNIEGIGAIICFDNAFRIINQTFKAIYFFLRHMCDTFLSLQPPTHETLLRRLCHHHRRRHFDYSSQSQQKLWTSPVQQLCALSRQITSPSLGHQVCSTFN